MRYDRAWTYDLQITSIETGMSGATTGNALNADDKRLGGNGRTASHV
jgi:hypothetical protein